MLDLTYRNDPYEYLSDNPCDYCSYQNTDKCVECCNRGLAYGMIESEDK